MATPRITGTTRVGEVLTVRDAAWSPRPESISIQWYADREPITGASGTRLRLTAAHLGKRISARMTARREGYRRSTLLAPRTGDVDARPVRDHRAPSP